MHTCLCAYQFTFGANESNRVSYVKCLYEGGDQENTMGRRCAFTRFIHFSNTQQARLTYCYVLCGIVWEFTNSSRCCSSDIAAFTCYVNM